MELDRVFKELICEEWDRVCVIVEIKSYVMGDIIVCEGDHVDVLFVVIVGVVCVIWEYLDDLSIEFTGFLGFGDVIGEMLFLDGVGVSVILVVDG